MTATGPQTVTSSTLYYSPSDGSQCMECTFRKKDEPHAHEVVAFVYDGQTQEGWFPRARIRWVQENHRLVGSWTHQQLGDEEYMKLALDNGEHYVWKLTDQLNETGNMRLGVWPD